jgi:cytochrome P450
MNYRENGGFMAATVATLAWTEQADLDDPHETLRRARAQHWWASNAFGITVLSHDGVRALLADPRLEGTGMMFLQRFGITAGPIFEFGSNMLFTTEGARHRRLRQLVSKAFTPRAVEIFRPRIRAIAEQLSDRLAERAEDGMVEFVSAFADPYPAWVLCEFMGLSYQDAGRFSSLANDLGLFFSVRIAEEQERITRAIAGLYALMDEVIADRRAHPRDDFVTRLVQAEADGDRLSRGELRSCW